MVSVGKMNVGLGFDVDILNGLEGLVAVGGLVKVSEASMVCGGWVEGGKGLPTPLNVPESWGDLKSMVRASLCDTLAGLKNRPLKKTISELTFRENDKLCAVFDDISLLEHLNPPSNDSTDCWVPSSLQDELVSPTFPAKIARKEVPNI